MEPDQTMSDKGKYGKYCKGKGKDDFAWLGKSKPVGVSASSVGKSAQSSYGKYKCGEVKGKDESAWLGKSKTVGDDASSAGKSAPPSFGKSK